MGQQPQKTNNILLGNLGDVQINNGEKQPIGKVYFGNDGSVTITIVGKSGDISRRRFDVFKSLLEPSNTKELPDNS